MSKEIESVIKTSQHRKQDGTRELHWRILPNIQIMNNNPSQTPPKTEEDSKLILQGQLYPDTQAKNNTRKL